MTESAIQPKPFPRDFCMFDIIELQIDSNASLLSLALIIASTFKFE